MARPAPGFRVSPGPAMRGAGSLLTAGLRPVLWRLPMLVLISLIVFVVLRAMPVDPLGMLLPASATSKDVAALTQELGLDQPWPLQFGIWMRQAVQGDFGQSIQSGLPVTRLMLDALPTTLQLLASGMAMGLLIGVGSGLLAFRFRGTPLEKAIQFVNGVTMAIPDFLWAILLILGVGIGLRWLPFMGPIDAGMSVERLTGFLLIDTLLAGDMAALGSALSHLALPSIALGLGVATPLARILHASLLDIYTEDYIMAARLRGVPESRVLLHHALRNAALPAVSLVGVQASTVIGGTLLIESIFGLPGIGGLMLRAIGSHDLPVIQALAVCYAVTVQLAALVTDLLLRRINPRLRVSP